MFFLLQLYNIFCDRIFRDQFVDIDYVFLPDPVGTVCRLVLDCQVPPRIVVDHNIRRRQIQTGASGFQGDQKNSCWVIFFIKLLHQLCPLFLSGRTGQHIVRRFFVLQPVCQPAQHRGKLGKYKNLMSVFHRVSNQIHTHLKFCRLSFIFFKKQCGVTADLTQFGQFG